MKHDKNTGKYQITGCGWFVIITIISFASLYFLIYRNLLNVEDVRDYFNKGLQSLRETSSQQSPPCTGTEPSYGGLLVSGKKYFTGTDINPGNYNFKVIEGSGTINISAPKYRLSLKVDAIENSQYTDILRLEKESTIKLYSKSSGFKIVLTPVEEKQQERMNSSNGTKNISGTPKSYLLSQGMYISGKHFAAGKYTIEGFKGKGKVTVSTPSERKLLYISAGKKGGSKPEATKYNIGYRNIILPEKAVLNITSKEKVFEVRLDGKSLK